jgi:hypothetical protein
MHTTCTLHAHYMQSLVVVQVSVLALPVAASGMPSAAR